MDERLQKNGDRYVYYLHSLYPLDIELNRTKTHFEVTVRKHYKGHLNKKLVMKSKIVGKMTKEQEEGYILDVIDIFIRKT